jgi:hypothetical protein
MNIDEIKRWELGEVGRVLTELNRGALSLWIVGVGIPGTALILIQMLMAIIGMAIEASLRIGSAFAEGGSKMFNLLFENVKRHPGLALGSAILTAVFIIGLWLWKPSREWMQNQTEKIQSVIGEIASATSRLITEISQSIGALIDTCYEHLPILLEWAECLGNSSLLLFRRVEELEQL